MVRENWKLFLCQRDMLPKMKSQTAVYVLFWLDGWKWSHTFYCDLFIAHMAFSTNNSCCLRILVWSWTVKLKLYYGIFFITATNFNLCEQCVAILSSTIIEFSVWSLSAHLSRHILWANRCMPKRNGWWVGWAVLCRYCIHSVGKVQQSSVKFSIVIGLKT